MSTSKSKADIGMALIVAFVITLVTGVILHLKKHGMVVEPRQAIKVVHWIAGLAMTALAVWHFSQFRRALGAMKRGLRMFWCDSWMVAVTLAAVFATGAVKLLSPVRIPHLGQWHYVLGLVMAAFIAVHLVRGIPAWRRLRRRNRG